ncbi:hypothetical protein CYMTET_13061 [Cymbomonas tetramitiformis]|uniref:Uncharacterized protein n=1 Tax=Cymbomonas tetramitiformis TaxID=36881 RepID=A0AAE0F4P2_9CHLO|nr:hypothetical protein CYMTET_39253 [Cymbomonas tetramitiformis]KAK3279038.1 hypothetical protein CYMTET_13061 [Cymbomonas tetramitiformis]
MDSPQMYDLNNDKMYDTLFKQTHQLVDASTVGLKRWAKPAFIEKVYAGTDGLVTSSVLTKWLKELGVQK